MFYFYLCFRMISAAVLQCCKTAQIISEKSPKNNAIYNFNNNLQSITICNSKNYITLHMLLYTKYLRIAIAKNKVLHFLQKSYQQTKTNFIYKLFLTFIIVFFLTWNSTWKCGKRRHAARRTGGRLPLFLRTAQTTVILVLIAQKSRRTCRAAALYQFLSFA